MHEEGGKRRLSFWLQTPLTLCLQANYSKPPKLQFPHHRRDFQCLSTASFLLKGTRENYTTPSEWGSADPCDKFWPLSRSNESHIQDQVFNGQGEKQFLCCSNYRNRCLPGERGVPRQSSWDHEATTWRAAALEGHCDPLQSRKQTCILLRHWDFSGICFTLHPRQCKRTQTPNVVGCQED